MRYNTLTADLRLCPACSRTANEVVLVRQLSSRQVPSQRRLCAPSEVGN